MPVTSAPDTAPPDSSSTRRSALHLLRYSFSVNPRGCWLTIATALAGSLAEGLGLVLLLPLLASAGMNFGGNSTASHITSAALSLLTRSGIPARLWLPTVLVAFLLAAATRSMLRRLQSTLLYTTTNTIQLILSRRLYASVVHAEWSFLVRQRGGSFTHVLTEQLGKVAEAIALMLTLINVAFVALLYLAIAIRLSPPMTGLVLAMGFAVMVLQRRSLGRTRASANALTRSVGEVYAATEEHLLNLKSVKTYDAEEREIQSFSDLCSAVVRHSIATAKHQAAAAFLFEVGSLVALAAVIVLAFGLFHVQGATMLILLGIFTRLMPQLASLQSQTHQFAATLPSYEHLLRIEADCLAHAEPPAPKLPPDSTSLRLTRELRVDGLWFRYPVASTATLRPAPEPPSLDHDPNTWVLRNLDFTVRAGLLTALAGPSGAGKSTLADLVTGLLTPTRGRILVDGRELTPASLHHWRARIGYVGQETVLFHQTIRDNLLWARPNATSEDLDRALHLAAATFVYDLPQGLDAVAGDRGILLSSGQRQRLAIARALLRRPSLLILDEATNALDTENEARILDALLDAVSTLSGDLTILMIAHRPSALARAHHIFELQAGQLAETSPDPTRYTQLQP
jgi:ATP-binding cassette subfamily C protein